MEAPRHTIIIYRLALLSFLFALAVFSAQSFALSHPDFANAWPPTLHFDQ